MYRCMHVNAVSAEVRETVRCPGGGAMVLVRCLMWELGTESQSHGRAEGSLNC